MKLMFVKMDYLTYSECLDYLLEMIEKERISTPQQIVQKFNCCDKTARNMVNHLRDKGYEIEFDRISGKYFIKNE